MKKLYLSNTDRKVSGLCGGIGEYYDIDPSLIRLAWILVTIITGIVPGILAYIVAIMVVPRTPQVEHIVRKVADTVSHAS